MITWMQKHKKVTIGVLWVTVITFIGAGAVGWGDVKFGNKATSIGTVGDLEIKISDYQQEKGAVTSRYSKQLGGTLTPEMIKKYKLDQRIHQDTMALLSQKGELLNLAKDYDISLDKDSVAQEVFKAGYAQKDGKFDKEAYIKILKQNGYGKVKNFEAMIKKDLTIQRVNQLLSSTPLKGEDAFFDTILALSDKIRYKKLDSKNIKIDVTKDKLKSFWEINKNDYKTVTTVHVEQITVATLDTKPTQEAIETYYKNHSFNFLDEKGAILPLKAAKDDVIAAINDEATSLKAKTLSYDWKDQKLPSTVKIEKRSFTQADAPYDQKIVQEIMTLQEGGMLKSRKVATGYAVIKLATLEFPRVKTFEEASSYLTSDFIAQEKRNKLQEMANAQQEIFKGKTSAFITLNDTFALDNLAPNETKTFLQGLFTAKDSKGQIAVSDEMIVLYEIMDQKLLFSKQNTPNPMMVKQIQEIKEQSRLGSMLKALATKYPTKMYN